MSAQAVIGIAAILALAWLAGERHHRIPWRIVCGALAIQAALAALLLLMPASRGVFAAANIAVEGLQAATQAGTSFVFGYIGGAAPPFDAPPGKTFILAFQALPLILVISALSALLFHWRVLQPIVTGFAWVLGRPLRIGGAVGVAAAANVFVGMIEAPLLVRPYLNAMSRGGLFAVMVCGLATIAGTMFVIYATVLSSIIPDAAGHLLTASLLNAPAALAIAALMIPPDDDAREIPAIAAADTESAMDAVVKGTVAGVQLLLNVIALLIVMVALIALANQILAVSPDIGGEPLTLQRLLGWLAAPLAWSIGIPWDEAAVAGGLIGTKVILNEFIAYANMTTLPAGALSERSELILAYAMCGFANLGSLGILIGALTTMVPGRRSEIVAMGWRALLAGVLATCLTGALAGLLIPG